MNQPIDHKHQDAQISALYQGASAEQPPTHLDDAILAAAKREVSAKPQAFAPFSTRWTLPFSLAAVVVLSVSVVTLVQREPSKEIVSDASEATPDLQEEKPAELKLQTAAPRAKPEIKATEIPSKPQSPMKKAQPVERLTERPALLRGPQPEAEARSSRSGLSSETTGNEILADSAAKPSEAAPVAEAEKAITLSRTTVWEEPKMEEPKIQEPKADITQPADSEITASSATIQSADESRQQSRRGVLAFKLGSDETLCALLTPKACLQSAKCTYILSDDSDEKDNRYLCRDATNHCEQDFDQLQGTKQSCESKPGCRFVPGHCNCPEAQPCDCQGKNPSQCVKQ